MTNSFIRLVRLSEEHTIAFKEEMQEAFQHGFEAYNKDGEETNQWQVLPDKDFYQSLKAEGAETYEAVNEDGQRVGGAINRRIIFLHISSIWGQRYIILC